MTTPKAAPKGTMAIQGPIYRASVSSDPKLVQKTCEGKRQIYTKAYPKKKVERQSATTLP